MRALWAVTHAGQTIEPHLLIPSHWHTADEPRIGADMADPAYRTCGRSHIDPNQ